MVEEHETSREIGKPVEKVLDKIIDAGELNEKKDLDKINSIKSNGHNLVAQNTNAGDESPVDRVKFVGIENDDSICFEDSSEKEKLPPIPDGGWGWVVVISAFLVCACADGLTYSFGILHEEFTLYFETTQSKTSMIGSLFMSTPLLAGPIMSALVDRYGCRIMTILAGVLSAIGFLLASVSNSVEVLCLTFGFLTGLAMGILYVTAVVSVAFWFDKRRTLAVSLASCGMGFGTVFYSPLTNHLLYVYDWRNTVVLLAGTLLNMCVCGALMRNPEWLEVKMKRERKERKLSSSKSGRSSSNNSVGSIGGQLGCLTVEEIRDLVKSGKSAEYILSTLATTIAEAEKLEATTQMNAEQPSRRRLYSAIHPPTFVQHNEKVPAEVIEKLMANKRLYNIILQTYPDILARRQSEVNIGIEAHREGKNESAELPVTNNVKQLIHKSETKESVENNNKENEPGNALTASNTKFNEEKSTHKTNTHTHTSDNMSPTNWFSRQISTDHHYLREIPLYKNTLVHRGAMLNIYRYKLRASSLPDIYRNSMWSLASEADDETKWYHRFWKTMKSTFNFRMFGEFHFLMFNVASLILALWSIVPFFFLKSYMTATGVDEGALMISIIGVASSIGIAILGWAGDQPWMNVSKTFAVCLIICGLSVAAYPPFITNYWALTVISTVFGLSFASSYSYTPAILIELMPIDHFTVGYGLILLSQGIGRLVGPPIGGMLFDITGTWDLTFYVSGVWLVISGVCVGVIAYTKDVRMCGSAPLLKEADGKSGSGVNV